MSEGALICIRGDKTEAKAIGKERKAQSQVHAQSAQMFKDSSTKQGHKTAMAVLSHGTQHYDLLLGSICFLIQQNRINKL